MSVLEKAWRRVRALAYRTQMERELAEEMDAHVELQTRKHIANGMPPGQARELARLEFGNAELVKEDARDARGVRPLEELVQDVRFSVRILRRSPAFAAVSVVAIGIAIGINAGFFTLVDAFVWRPIPVARPQGLVKAALRLPQGSSILWSYPQVQAIAAHAATLSDVLPSARCSNVAFRASSSRPASPAAPGCVSGNYFTALGGRAQLGRVLGAADDRRDADAVVVLSDAYWTHAFARAPDVVGRDVVVNGIHATVAGVMSASFVGLVPLVPDFWMTIPTAERLGATPGRLDDTTNRFIDLKARLAPGVSRAQAEAELSGYVIEPVVRAQRSDPRRIVGVLLTPNDSMLAPSLETMLLLAPALVVVALVLVIACANLGTLMLSRALARQREIAVRLAIGASRSRLVRQLLTEALVLSLAGAALGLALARVTVSVVARAFFSAVPELYGRVVLNLSPSWRVVAYTIGLAALAVLCFGLAPALQATSQSLTASLKGEDVALGTRIRRSRFRDLLVAAQVTGSFVLLVASATLVVNMRSFGEKASGLDTRGVIVATLGMAAPGHVAPELAASRAAFDARVAALRDVGATARALHAPYTSWWPLLAVAAGTGGAYRRLQYNAVTPGYFAVMRQPIVEGRAFTAGDSASGAPVAIVTQAAARVLWPRSPAIGQTLHIWSANDEPDRLARVVGVAADAHSGMVWDNDAWGYVYLPTTAADFSAADMPVLLRATAAPLVTRAMQDIARQIDPNAPLAIEPAQNERDVMLMPIRYGTWITTVVGLFGLALALLGLYGIVSFAVLQRRRDIAVHIALGARSREVIGVVVSRELRLVGLGLLVGVALAVGEVRLIAAWHGPLESLGPVTFGALAAVLFAVAFTAILVPALSALRIAPMNVLRQE